MRFNSTRADDGINTEGSVTGPRRDDCPESPYGDGQRDRGLPRRRNRAVAVPGDGLQRTGRRRQRSRRERRSPRGGLGVARRLRRRDRQLHRAPRDLAKTAALGCGIRRGPSRSSRLGMLAVVKALRPIRRMLQIRQYKDEAVPDEIVEQLLDLGRWTGSSKNGQPWHFIVVRDRESLRRIAGLRPNINWAASAPVAIAI